MNGESEKELSASWRSTQGLAYTIVKTYSGRVFAICLGMLGNIHDAEDIAQQALLKALTNINQVRDNEHFGAWISRITKNLCIDYIRMQKRRQSSVTERVETGQSSSRDYTELESALAKLSDQYRIPLMLYYFDGRSAKAIAQTLKISEAAAQTRLSRARKQLRNLLESTEDT